MSYAKKIADVASLIKAQADVLDRLESEKTKWTKPRTKTFHIGGVERWVVREDGTVTPGLEGVQQAAIKVHDEAIFEAKSRLEGLRYQLVKLGREGGAA